MAAKGGKRAPELRQLFGGSKNYIAGCVKWLSLGLIIGLAGGLVGGAFHICVDLATGLRERNTWLLYLLPLAGLLIAALYKTSRAVLDTDAVIHAIHTSSEVSPLMVPLIFVSAVLSHLCGASVGRGGATLQIGGALGYNCGRLLNLDERDRHVLIMCGMSAVFSTNFGTPVTAAFFALEAASMGVIYYAGLLPCLTSALTASAVARIMGVEPLSLVLSGTVEVTVADFARAGVLGLGCAVLSIVFCRCLHNGERLAKRYIKNSFARIAAGGVLAVLLSWLSCTSDYNGLGSDTIRAAIAGTAVPEAFVMKLALTVICVCAGYKGGEMLPTMFVGSTFGCVAGPILGMEPGFAAGLCMVALFCAMVNCPIASLILSVELFGGQYFPLFAAACAVSYMMSGSYSLYLEQSMLYSKVKAMYINMHTR